MNTSGIILKKINIGEADASFIIYTRDFGKIRAIAPGVKKEKAKLKGHLEKMNAADISLVAGKNGFRLISALMKNHFGQIRKNFHTLQAAEYCLSFYDSLIMEGEKDEALWGLLYDSLLFLDKNFGLSGDEYGRFISLFEKRFIELSGYGKAGTGTLDLIFRLFGVKISRPGFV
jgi:DNA repair protein RecO (recombination protein O)